VADDHRTDLPVSAAGSPDTLAQTIREALSMFRVGPYGAPHDYRVTEYEDSPHADDCRRCDAEGALAALLSLLAERERELDETRERLEGRCEGDNVYRVYDAEVERRQSVERRLEDAQAALKHHGRLRGLPPYVGGDDDEITAWQAACDCGYLGRETSHLSVANGELTAHLNAAFRRARAVLAAGRDSEQEHEHIYRNPAELRADIRALLSLLAERERERQEAEERDAAVRKQLREALKRAAS
jgi:hypothetical protein